MSIRVRCPKCDAAYNIADEKKGKSIRCAKCQTVFRAAAPEPDDDDDETEAQPAPKPAAAKKPAPNGGIAAGKPRRPVDDDDDEAPKAKKPARRARDEENDDDEAERPAKKKSGVGGCLIGCGVLALVLLLGVGGAAIYGFYWLKGKAGELADEGQARLKKLNDDLKKEQERIEKENKAKQAGQPGRKDVLKDGPKDRPPTTDGLAKDGSKTGPPMADSFPKIIPTRLPPGPFTWQTFNSGPPANFVAQFPGKPGVNIGSSTPGEGYGSVSVEDTQGTQFAVVWKDWGRIHPGKSPRELLDLVVMKSHGRYALMKMPLILAAGQTGFEFVTEKDLTNQPRNRTERTYAVGSRVYRVYVESPCGVKAPADAATRFLTAFRVSDPATTGGPKTPKTPIDPPPAGVTLAKLTLAEPMGWNGKYLAATNEWFFTRPVTTTGRKTSNTLRIKASGDTGTLEDYQAKVALPGFMGPKIYKFFVTASEPLPDGFVIRVRSERTVPTKSKLPSTGIGVVVVRNVGGVRLIAIAASLANEEIRNEAIAALRSARLGP